MIYTAQEFAKLIGTTEKAVISDFPDLGVSKLKKGILIKREKIDNQWTYDFEKVEPQINPDKKQFQINPNYKKYQTEITKNENEVWIDTYLSSDYEVSNYGQVRDKRNGKVLKGTNHKGYRVISLNSQNYRLHRIVLQSFYPINNYKEMIVDHINGKRDDNRLENLRWVTSEENTQLMLFQRADMNKELTRIIQIYGYDKTLEILQDIK